MYVYKPNNVLYSALVQRACKALNIAARCATRAFTSNLLGVAHRAWCRERSFHTSITRLRIRCSGNALAISPTLTQSKKIT